MKASLTPYEIIVVNDGGTPDLRDKLAVLPKECQLIYARITEDIPWNYNGACNLGAWLSTGSYLMFEDNDNIPTRTTYQEMIDYFKANPEVGKLTGTKRMEIEQQDLDKPLEEWVMRGKRGANMGTAMIRRNIYLMLKGHDERFCGRYGWMYYDYRARLLKITKISGKGQFWYVRDAQSNLDRKTSSINWNLYRKNARAKIMQHQGGILNFNYTFEYL